MLDSSLPSRNYGGSSTILAGGGYVGLLEFDLSSLPAGVRIRRATLELTTTSSWPGAVEIHQVTSSWDEGICTGGLLCLTGGANWNIRQGLSSWSTPGGDYGSRVWSRFDVSLLGAVTADVTSLVESWHSGTANRGMALTMSTGGPAEFASSENSVVASRPKLTIEYSCECSEQTRFGVRRIQPGAGFGKDSMLRGESAGDQRKNYGAASKIGVEGGKPDRVILEFDLESLPTNAIVTRATLELQALADPDDKSPSITIHRVTSSWTEGTGGNSGLDPADGVTWDTVDGTTLWSSAGADFDSEPVDTLDLTTTSSRSLAWDITPLVFDWHAGTVPNQGVLLQATDAGSDRMEFASSDEADETLRPKLTIDYVCPCGLPCLGSGLAGERLLMVVTDPDAPGSEELAVEAILQSFGFLVTRIAQDDPQADVDAALADQDVVFVSSQTSAASIDSKLSAARIGVVYENAGLADELAVASSVRFDGGDSIEIVTDMHPITMASTLGNLEILSTSEAIASIDGTSSPDLVDLAEKSGRTALAALESRGARVDGLGPVEGRRVQLPWADPAHSSSHLTPEAIELLEDAVEWAASDPPIPSGYLDRFEFPTCDDTVDYLRSHGSLDWTRSPWIESEATDPCGGDITIERVDDSYRLRVSGDATIERAVNLSGFSVASLRFRYQTNGTLDASHYLRIDASNDDGINWSEIGRIDAPSATSWEQVAYKLNALIDATTRIRLSAVDLSAGRSVDVDEIEVVEVDTPGGPCLETYIDSVGALRYSGDDGSLSWSTNWLEVNESDGILFGDEVVTWKQSDLRLRVADNDGGGEGLMREADLSSASWAYLSFEYLREDFDDDGDYVMIQASGDGGLNWTTLDSLGGNVDDSSFRDAIYSLTDFIAPDTRIRFLTSPDLGGSDRFYFDEVRICLQ